ncbi:hypothetical protein [Pelosinus baikalensis]|nr:hypothetical protein [Pelosinus baikalensis]
MDMAPKACLIPQRLGLLLHDKHTFFSPGRFEREANEFAWQLLFDEEACRVEYDNDLGRYVREEGIVGLVGIGSSKLGQRQENNVHAPLSLVYDIFKYNLLLLNS